MTIQPGDFWVADIPSHLDCLEKSLLLGKIGTLSAADRQIIRQAWAAHIKPDFNA